MSVLSASVPGTNTWPAFSKNAEKAEPPKTHKEHQHGATAQHLFAHLPLRALLGWNYSCVILTANLSQGFEVLVLDGST